jgi:hypothetical protein
MGEECDICNSREWKRMCHGESSDATLAIARVNRNFAEEYLNKDATAMCPKSGDIKHGKATKFDMLPCGDALFYFEYDDTTTAWVHEIEPC